MKNSLRNLIIQMKMIKNEHNMYQAKWRTFTFEESDTSHSPEPFGEIR